MEVTNRECNLFVEKYKPNSIEDVIGNDELSIKFREFIEKKEINNLLFVGCQGAGKTLSAKIISNAISEDVMYINASNESGIDVIRNKIVNFCSSATFNDNFKIIILDEADGISPQGQGALRAVMEEFIGHTRFILTCNFLNKILKPLKSRCEVFEFKGGDKTDMIKRCLQILKMEGVKGTKDGIVGNIKELVNAKYPDFRSVLNTMQKLVQEKDGKKTLSPYTSLNDDMRQIIDLIRTKKLTKLREYVKEQGMVYDDIYRFVFDNAKTICPEEWTTIWIQCQQFQFENAFVADPEICAMAFFSEIMDLIPD
jgi:DNA polymerase III delta prime subunit